MFKAFAAIWVAVSLWGAGPQALLPVRDIDGRAWTPLAPATGEINVLFFVTAECPVSNRYAPEITRIISAYQTRGVRAWLVYADPRLDSSRARAHLKDFYPGQSIAAIIDTGFELTSAAGVTITPEAVVYAGAGRAYRGRIDDLYVTLGQSRRQATRHDLRLALDSVLAGRPVISSETHAVGCYIEKR